MEAEFLIWLLFDTGLFHFLIDQNIQNLWESIIFLYDKAL